MNADDLIPFDPSIVPWATSVDDWALCITTEPAGRVWVEHALIRAMLAADHLDDTLTNHHGMLVAIGGKVAAALDRPGYALTDAQAREVSFVGNPVVMHAGRFGGETFVFLPRQEFLRRQSP
jgi:hypothetical protein